MGNEAVAGKGKAVAAAWTTKLAMAAAVLGATVGANVDTALADHHYVQGNGGMPEAVKTHVIETLEAVQIKVEMAPETVQAKVESKLDAVQHKVDLR